MTSFLSAANSAKIASTTPSQLVPTNSYYSTLPLFVDYQTTALKLPFVSSASYPYLQVSLKTVTELQFILQQAVTTEVDANDEPVTLVDETPILVPAQTVPGSAPPSAIIDFETPSDVAYFQVTSPYFRIVVVNTSAIQTGLLFMTTKLISTRPSNALQYKDSVLIGALTSAGTATALRTTTTGDLIINGTAGSATRRVDFLVVGTFYRVASVGLTTGAQWNAIGAIVDGESEPTVGRLFKCLALGPAVQGGGECYDVEYTDTVNVSVPAGITGSVDILAATNPALTIGKVRVADFYGDPILTTAGNLMVGINNIYTANPLHTIVDSGSITTTESSSLVKSFDQSSSLQIISTSAGKLQSLSLVNDNTALAFVALYNTTSVTPGTTTPLAVVVIQKDQAIQLVTHNLAFSTALSFFCATTYNGPTALANVYVTASYT
jgi:hypothetical protein